MIQADQSLEDSIKDIKRFLLLNKMKLNDDKTEFLIIGTRQQREKITKNKLKIGESEIKKAPDARNLGVFFDEDISMTRQVNEICKKGYYKLRSFAEIRPYLDEKTARTVAQALLTSTLDYGNSLFYGISKKNSNKLQALQNATVRVV